METTTSYATPLLTALEQIGPHAHHSLIYDSPDDHYSVAIPFIRLGLERGEQCIYIADDGTEAILREAMGAGGIDVERAIANDSLVLETKDGAFLKQGAFDPNAMPAFWHDMTAEAMKKGFRALRAARPSACNCRSGSRPALAWKPISRSFSRNPRDLDRVAGVVISHAKRICTLTNTASQSRFADSRR